MDSIINDTRAEVTLQRYATPTPGRFPIMAVTNSNTRDKGRTSIETLRILKNAGFSFIRESIVKADYPVPRTEEELIDDVLTDGQTVGIRLLIKPGGSSHFSSTDYSTYAYQRNRWISIAKRFFNRASLAGWFLIDEPNEIRDSANNLTTPSLDTIFSRLEETKNEILKDDPWQHIVCVNLPTFRSFEYRINDVVYPNSFLTDLTWFKGFRSYVRKYIQIFGPAVLTSSTYGFGSSLTGIQHQYGYFQNFELLKRLSYMIQRPFWGYFRCCYRWDKGGFIQKDQNGLEVDNGKKVLARYRSDVFCALAFGAQGICGWETTSHEESPKKEQIFYSPIDENGEVTVLMTYLTEVLSQVRRVEHIFLHGTVRECRFSATSDASKYFKSGAEAYPFGPLKTIYAQSTNTPGFLISLIENRDKTYMAFVNINMSNAESMRLIFDHGMKRVPVKPEDQETLISKGEPFYLSLDSGEMAIFEVR